MFEEIVQILIWALFFITPTLFLLICVRSLNSRIAELQEESDRLRAQLEVFWEKEPLE